MALSIKILKKVGNRSDMIASRSWPQSRITIGRGEECTLVLEDPKKHVSRVHVELEETSDRTFRMTVVSKVNPVFINGKRQLPGSHVDLNAGDRFELGEYELELLAPPSATRSPIPVSDVEETTQPNSPLLQVPKSSATPARPEKTVPVEALAPPAVPKPPEQEEPAFDADQLPPVEPGLFDEPEPVPEAPAPVAAAPAPPPAADVFAEATFIGSVPSAPTANLFDEATYVGGRPAT